MTGIIRRIPEWALWSGLVVAVVVPTVVLVASASSTVTLHRENREAQAQIEEAQAAIEHLAASNAAQDRALQKANKRLRQIGEQPVDPSGVSPFPFSFSFLVGETLYTVTCNDHRACLVQHN